MLRYLFKWRFFRVVAWTVLVAFVSMIPAQSGYAQTITPAAGQINTALPHFNPIVISGLRVDPKDPFNLSFLMSNGDDTSGRDDRQEEYKKLIKYFMASLITPNKDMWVNLSPKEANRIIPDNLSMTEMGRDLLAQDYLLKQFTASLMNPDDRLGKDFWAQIYKKSYEKYGTTDISVDTFNKVWITADRADIYQKNDTAFLVKSHLKVMLEQDFMAIESNKEQFSGVTDTEESSAASRKLASDIVRELIVPVIEKEVNEGVNFMKVRQAYSALIMAIWFKKALKDSLLGQVYADTSKVQGIALNDPEMKERIYQQYLTAYKNGVFNYIREELDPASQEMLPRKYFAGGITVDERVINTNVPSFSAAQSVGMNAAEKVVVNVDFKTLDGAELTPGATEKPAAEAVAETPVAGTNAKQIVEATEQAVAAKNEAAISGQRFYGALGFLKSLINRTKTAKLTEAQIAEAQREKSRRSTMRRILGTRMVNLTFLGSIVWGLLSPMLTMAGLSSSVPDQDPRALEVRQSIDELRAVMADNTNEINSNSLGIRLMSEQIEQDIKDEIKAKTDQEEGLVFARNMKLQVTEHAPIPVSDGIEFRPDAVAYSSLTNTLAKMMKAASTKIKNLKPVKGILESSYNKMDFSIEMSLGAGYSVGMLPDVPGANLINGVRIASSLSEIGSQGAISQVAGPVFLTQIAMELRNYLAMHPARGQDIQFDANIKLASGLLQTVTVHVTPIVSYDQNNNRITRHLVSMGLVDTLKTIAGKVDKHVFFDMGLVGDGSRHFILEDLGYQLQINDYHKAFDIARTINKDPNVFFVQTYQVDDANTRYRMNAKEGWSAVKDSKTPTDPYKDYYSATVRGFKYVYDPVTKKLGAKEVFAAPTFITKKFADTLAKPGENSLKAPLIERMPSYVDLKLEQILIEGQIKGDDGIKRNILGVLRNSITGRIERFIVDPLELNALSSVTDENGTRVLFLSGKARGNPNLVGGALIVAKDYGYDEVVRVLREWKDFLRPSTMAERYGNGKIIAGRPDLVKNPEVLEEILSIERQIFEAAPALKAIEQAARGQSGVIYFNNGNIPTPVPNITGLKTVASVFRNAETNGTLAQCGVTRNKAAGKYMIDGFAGKSLPGNVLVSLDENGRVNGIFNPSPAVKKIMIKKAQAANEIMEMRNRGFAEYGVATDVRTGRSRGLMQPESSFRTAASFKGIVGQVITVNDMDGTSKAVQITPRMKVRLEKGRVAEILEDGLKTKRDYLTVIETQKNGGHEVEIQGTGDFVTFASGNDLTDLQVEAGVRPESELVAYMAANIIEMVPADPAKPTGDKRMVALPEARPMVSGVHVQLTKTLAEFLKKNTLVIRKGLDGKEVTQWASLDYLNGYAPKVATRPQAQQAAPSSYIDTGKFYQGGTWSPIPAGTDRRNWDWNDDVPAVLAQINVLNDLNVKSVRVYTPITSKVILDKLRESGISVNVVIPYSDDRAPDKKIEKIDLVTKGSLEKFIKEYFPNYPAGSVVELGNEYNYHPEYFHGDINLWYDAVENAARLIHSIAPQVIVTTVHGEVPTPDVLRRLAKAGVDRIGINVYRGTDPIPAVKQLLQMIREVLGEKSTMGVYISEFGFSSWNERTGQDDPKTQEADFNTALNNLTGFSDPNYHGYFLMEVTRDEPGKEVEGGPKEGHFGLMDKNGAPKAAFTTFKNHLASYKPADRPERVIERAAPSEMTAKEFLSGARIVMLGLDGEPVGSMERMYGGKYEFWAKDQVASKLSNYYQIIYARAAGDSRAPVVEFATPLQVRIDFTKLSAVATRIEMIQQKPDGKPGDMQVLRRVYVAKGMSSSLAEIGTRINDRQESIALLSRPDRPIAIATIQNTIKTPDGHTMMVVERRGLTADGRPGALEGSSAVLVGEDGVVVSDDVARSYGSTYAQFFPAEYKDGAPVNGKVIIGFLDQGGKRFIYAYTVVKGENGTYEYKIDWSKPIGSAQTSTTLNILQKDQEALGLTGRGFILAEELNSSNQLMRAFIIDPVSNKEIGTINPLKLTDGKGQYFEAAIYDKEGKLVSSLIQSTEADGVLNLSFKKRISTAENKTPERFKTQEKAGAPAAQDQGIISFEALQKDVGALSKEFTGSVYAIADEIGIPHNEIEFVSSIKANEGNGKTISMRMRHDPKARVIVFYSDINSSKASILVNTRFSGNTPSMAYEWTVLGDKMLHETTQDVVSREDLEKQLGLDNVSELARYNGQLSYQHFSKFTGVTTYRLLDNGVRDKIQERFVAYGEDSLLLDYVVKAGNTVRLRQYEDFTSLDQRPLTVMSSEVVVMDGVVMGDIQFTGHDPVAQVYHYKYTYKHTREGVNNHPKDTIEYEYGNAGLVTERNPDQDYVSRSFGSMPLINRHSEVPFWQRMNPLAKAGAAVERDQSTFEVRVMQKGSLTFRLVKEVNVEGATPKTDLKSTLYVNGYPIAERNGTSVNKSVAFDSKWDVINNGIIGKVINSLGISTFVVTVPGMTGVEVDILSTINEMERPITTSASVDVKRMDTPEAKALTEKGQKAEAYHSFLKDYVLQPINLAIPFVAMFFVNLLPLLGIRKRKTTMNALKLSQLKKLESKKWGGRPADLPEGLAEKWSVYLAVNSNLVVKAFEDNEKKDAAVAKLVAALEAKSGFFNDQEIKALADLLRNGSISFDSIEALNMERDTSGYPSFTIAQIIGPGQAYESDARPVLALRYAFRQGWLTQADLEDMMASVWGRDNYKQEVGNQWVLLFELAKEKLLAEALTGQRSIEQTFPDPESSAVKMLISKGFSDELRAFVADENNGNNTHLRIQNYVTSQFLDPMTGDILADTPILGTSMSEIRKKPLSEAVMSEFYRFVMMNPALLPDISQRRVVTDQDGARYTFDPTVLDQVYNTNVVMKYSQVATFREKVVYHLLLMPFSETAGISLGPVAAIAPMGLELTRVLIAKLDEANRKYKGDPEKLAQAKKDAIEIFSYDARAWAADIMTNNWGSIFGGAPEPGLYKRITEPGGRIPGPQPNLDLPEVFRDSDAYMLFERGQAEKKSPGDTSVYDALKADVLKDDVYLTERLAMAEQLLADGKVLHGKAMAEKDPQRRAAHLERIIKWRNEVALLRSKTPDLWSDKERRLALALASESLFWELMTIKNEAKDNEKLEQFARGPVKKMTGGLLRKVAEYRLKDDSYSYFLNDISKRWKGGLHLFIFNRFIPKNAMGPVCWLMSRTLGTMAFKASEFNGTELTDLAKRMNGGASVADPLKYINDRLHRRDLYKASDMQNLSGLSPEDRHLLGSSALNSRQLERLNRRLIESNFPEAPKSLEFYGPDGQRTYRLQSSLEHYYGIENKYVRYGIVAFRAVMTPLAVFFGLSGGLGLAVAAISAAWFLPPLLFGNFKKLGERSLWISVLGVSTGITALLASLLLGKVTLMSLMASGTFVTLGLGAVMVLFLIMGVYSVARLFNGTVIYQNQFWNKYWVARTVGWQSWLLFRPIVNVSWFRKNFYGEFYGSLLGKIIVAQRKFGPLCPAGWLVQDVLIRELRTQAGTPGSKDQNGVPNLSPKELKAWEASVTFIAHYRDGIKPGDPEWLALAAAARSYEEALAVNGVGAKDPNGRQYLNMLDSELIALKRPFVCIEPRSEDVRKVIYNLFQTIVLSRSPEDPFAHKQAVSVHLHSFNENITFTLEGAGRLGTHNIAGLREFMPKLKAEFIEFLRTLKIPDGTGSRAYTQQEIDAKVADLVAAANIPDYPFTLVNVVARFKSLTDPEKTWLTARLAKAKDDVEISETSLIGYNLRNNPEMRENMINNLLLRGPNGEYEELALLLRGLEETDDVTAAFMTWAKGRSPEVVQVAVEAINSFMNLLNPSNITMLKRHAEEVMHMHLAAAKSYGDLDYYDQARRVFDQYGSLAYAAENISDDDPQFGYFKKNFKHYQKSAKLKTTAMLQYVLVWSGENEFRRRGLYERQDDYELNDIDVSKYAYTSKAADSILNLKGSPLRDKFEAVLIAATADPESGVKYVRTKDGKRAVVFCREMRDLARIFLEFRKNNYNEILALPNNREAALWVAIYEMMLYVEWSFRADSRIPFIDPMTDSPLTGNKNGVKGTVQFQEYDVSLNLDAYMASETPLFNQSTADFVGQNPEVVIVNPALRIWGLLPGTRAYAVAQEAFVELQRSMYTAFYGKALVRIVAANTFLSTPIEDTAAFMRALATYPFVRSIMSDGLRLLWGRPSQKRESVEGTEGRYSGNVTQGTKAPELFEMSIKPRVDLGYKFSFEKSFNHYMLAIFGLGLLAFVPGLQGFSALAFLKPAVFVVPLVFMAMHAINVPNIFLHRRTEGNVALALTTSTQDTVNYFPYYVSMTATAIKSFILSANNAFKFLSTVKTPVFGTLDRRTRLEEGAQLQLLVSNSGKMERSLRIGGLFGMGGGATLLTLSLFSVISPNLVWLGPVVAVVGGAAYVLSKVFKYRFKTINGKPVAPIPIPFDSLMFLGGNFSWAVGLVFSGVLGPIITIPYLLATWANMTGNNVNDVFTEKVEVEKGKFKLRISGKDNSKMLTENKQALKVCLGAMAALIGFAFLPVAIPVVTYSVNLALCAIIAGAIYKGAFSNISEAFRYSIGKVLGWIKTINEVRKSQNLPSKPGAASAAPAALPAPVVPPPVATPATVPMTPIVEPKVPELTPPVDKPSKPDLLDQQAVVKSYFKDHWRKTKMAEYFDEKRHLTASAQPLTKEEKARQEKADIKGLIKAQEDRFEYLRTLKESLAAGRNDTDRWKSNYRKISTQIGILENKTLPRLRRILGTSPLTNLKALNTEIKKGREGIAAMPEGADKDAEIQRVAAISKDVAFVMRSARAFSLKNASFLVEATTVLSREELGKLDDSVEVDQMIERHKGSGASIRYLASLKKSQRVAAVKNLIQLLDAEGLIEEIQPVPTTAEVTVKEKVLEGAVGGINLSDEHLTINIQVDGNGLPLPARFQDPVLINIQGLQPVIRGISPVDPSNMPVIFELLQMSASADR